MITESRSVLYNTYCFKVTIPTSIINALGVEKKDDAIWHLDEHGVVTVTFNTNRA